MAHLHGANALIIPGVVLSVIAIWLFVLFGPQWLRHGRRPQAWFFLFATLISLVLLVPHLCFVFIHNWRNEADNTDIANPAGASIYGSLVGVDLTKNQMDIRWRLNGAGNWTTNLQTQSNCSFLGLLPGIDASHTFSNNVGVFFDSTLTFNYTVPSPCYIAPSSAFQWTTTHNFDVGLDPQVEHHVSNSYPNDVRTVALQVCLYDWTNKTLDPSDSYAGTRVLLASMDVSTTRIQGFLVSSFLQKATTSDNIYVLSMTLHRSYLDKKYVKIIWLMMWILTALGILYTILTSVYLFKLPSWPTLPPVPWEQVTAAGAPPVAVHYPAAILLKNQDMEAAYAVPRNFYWPGTQPPLAPLGAPLAPPFRDPPLDPLPSRSDAFWVALTIQAALWALRSAYPQNPQFGLYIDYTGFFPCVVIDALMAFIVVLMSSRAFQDAWEWLFRREGSVTWGLFSAIASSLAGNMLMKALWTIVCALLILGLVLPILYR